MFENNAWMLPASAALALLTPNAQAQGWSDDFDSYVAGSQVEGQGGWHTWGGGTTAFSLVEGTLAAESGANSMSVASGADSVREFTGIDAGAWIFKTHVYMPLSGAQGKTYFILLNSYTDTGGWEWSVQLGFDMDTGFLACDCGSGSPLNSPIMWDQWVEVRAEFNLDADSVDLYYGGVLQATYLWSEGPFGADMYSSLRLQAVDLYPDSVGGTPSTIYFDSFDLSPLDSGVGTNYCTANPNSTGAPALMDAQGSASIADNNLVISAEPVPTQPGIFFYADNQLQIPFGNGFLCAGGTIIRFAPSVPAADKAERTIDVAAQGIAPGSLNFQYWYRDPAGGGAFFNTSDGLEIVFVP